jgi:hypothetical protein
MNNAEDNTNPGAVVAADGCRVAEGMEPASALIYRVGTLLHSPRAALHVIERNQSSRRLAARSPTRSRFVRIANSARTSRAARTHVKVCCMSCTRWLSRAASSTAGLELRNENPDRPHDPTRPAQRESGPSARPDSTCATRIRTVRDPTRPALRRTRLSTGPTGLPPQGSATSSTSSSLDRFAPRSYVVGPSPPLYISPRETGPFASC